MAMRFEDKINEAFRPEDWVENYDPWKLTTLRSKNRARAEAKYTQEDWLREVRRGKHLGTVPEKFINQEMCDAAMEFWPLRFQSIPEKFRTEEHWLAALEARAVGILEVPGELVTSRMWEIALKSDASLLADMDKKFLTRDLISKVAGHWRLTELYGYSPGELPGWFWLEVFRIRGCFLGAHDQDFLTFCLERSLDTQDPKSLDKFNGKIHFRRKGLVL